MQMSGTKLAGVAYVQRKVIYMPDDVRFNKLVPESVKEGLRDLGVGAKRSPEGVEAADLRSSAAFLLPPSMLKGRNQPEGAGLADAEAALEAGAGDPLAEAEAELPASMHCTRCGHQPTA